MTQDFKATHVIDISYRGGSGCVHVMLHENYLYTRKEWNDHSPAKWMIRGDRLLLQGPRPDPELRMVACAREINDQDI